MKIIPLCLITIGLLTIFGCKKFEDRVYRIRVENRSSATIESYISYNYPDTAIAATKPEVLTIVPAGSGFWDSQKKYEDLVASDTLTIFFFNKDTVDKYTWNEIRDGRKMLDRYDLNIKDLDNQGFVIQYQ